MLKNIQLKLTQIKYRGDSIGDDIRIELKVLGKFLRVDKRVRPRTTALVNQIVGIFESDQKIFKFNTQVIVIEKDMLFNDVGIGGVDIKVDTTTARSQKFSCEVTVRETRSIFGVFWGKRAAVFKIILEAKVHDAIMCVPMTKDGWLKVLLEKNKKTVSLPTFLQIKIDSIIRKRERFMILEGAYRGEMATVKLLADGSSRFVSIIGYAAPAFARYSISQRVFSLNGREYKAINHSSTPWKKGLYDIEIPDAPHRAAREYLAKAKLAKIWFRVSHSGERYLHAGRVSLGCMTIIEIKKWDKVCEILLKARKGDFMSVGSVEVVD